MKKTLLLLLTLMCSVMTWAQDPDWSVTSFGGSISDNSTTINEATWTLSDLTVGAGSPAWTVGSNKWKFGSSKSVFWSSYTLSTNKFNSYNITKVEVGCYDNGGTESSVTAKQGSVTIGTVGVSTTTTSNVATLNANQGEGGALQIIFTSTKQASYITSIKVWYTLGGDAVHVESVTLDKHNLTIMASKSATLTATVAPVNATNTNVSWSSSDEDVATVDKGVVKALKEGTTTITVTTADGNKTDQCAVTVTAKAAPAGAKFYESFDKLDGVGGNDGTWSGISSTYAWDSEACDNTGWTTEGTMNKGKQCASIRKGSSNGTNISSGLTTPAIGKAGDGHITFNAQSWTNDTGDFYVDIVGGGTFTAASGVTLSNNGTTAKIALTKKSEWKDYDLSFTGLTADSKFRFYMAAGKRGFLDEVAVFVTPTTGELPFVATDGNGGYYATFSSDKAVAMPAEDGDVMYEVYAVNVENGKMDLYDFSESIGSIDTDGNLIIPANTGVLVYAMADEAPTMTYTYTTVAGAVDDINAVNMLRPASAEKETEGFKFYKLAYASSDKDGLGFYWGADDGAAFISREGSAYLAVPTGPAAKSGFAFNDEDTTTGINNVKAEAATGVAYNLAGQRVNATVKGIVIMNGKKFINK